MDVLVVTRAAAVVIVCTFQGQRRASGNNSVANEGAHFLAVAAAIYETLSTMVRQNARQDALKK
jgi:hypothetical protein